MNPTANRTTTAALLLIAASALLGGCFADPAPELPAIGGDVALPDAAPDASTTANATAPGRAPLAPTAQPRAMMRGADGQVRPLPNAADPHAGKRNFHLAWLRVSMPTNGGAGSGTMSATFVPENVPGRGYWRVLDSKVHCDGGAAPKVTAGSEQRMEIACPAAETP